MQLTEKGMPCTMHNSIKTAFCYEIDGYNDKVLRNQEVNHCIFSVQCIMSTTIFSVSVCAVNNYY